MTDYDALANKLMGIKKASDLTDEKLANHGFDPVTFYQYVKVQVEVEVDNANVELRKRKLPLVERVFIPGFQGKLSLTFGTEFLCTVELHESKGRIRAVIFGPPNRDEIARKDFFLNPAAANLQGATVSAGEKVAVGYSPQKIAAEIISGLLMGEFA